MGKHLVDMSISNLIFDDGCCLDLPGWSTCHLRLKLQKFPSPRWDFHIFCACACRAAVSLSTAARLPSHRAPSRATQLTMCVLTLKSSHRPHGNIAHALALILACTTATDASVNYSMYVPQRPSKVPIAPMGFSHVLRLCLQGGGVFVESGTVSFLSCTITGNSATYVRAQLKTSHRPDGKTADALAPTHACITANASVNHRGCVPQRP